VNDVKELSLWKVLKEDKHRNTVRELVEYAAPLLDHFVETFPTYTLHNSRHAVNVARIMADLLGAGVKNLEPLEAAMLILSAYFHDIGMVFKPEELESLTLEKEWKEFLNKYPEAFVAVEKNHGVTPDIAEWYCRWRHADRVMVYLNDEELEKMLKWGQYSIRDELYTLCRSHNDNTKQLAENPKLGIFRGEADLKFCAILLRLADILDFDRSRSPDSVYHFLGLSRRDTKRHEQSDVEWRKHLCSEGFDFPPAGKRKARYELPLKAAPEHPAVEYDVRQFLDVIDGELEQCAALLNSCSEKWRGFVLPARIKRDFIQSKGYCYGEYRFALEQNQVLDLLMGENLYENPYAFVRELVQNAIDTTRHRCYVEHARGKATFKPEPIRISEWRDQEGYQWVRFDDFGMGMDEEIVRNYLLKVGSSYYNTARFKADLLRAQQWMVERQEAAPDFTPISRFGIGLLSCFITGDRVEINSLHQDPNGDKSDPVRLSLNGPHGFYTLQMSELKAEPMPAAHGKPPAEVDYLGYRRESGTSLAVRLDPRKEKGAFELGNLLTQYVLCSPVPIEFNGELVGGDPAVLVDKPWCERQTITLTGEEMASIENLLCYKFREPFQIELLPLDLTKHSPTPELKGQLLVLVVRSSLEWQKLQEIVPSFGRLETEFGSSLEPSDILLQARLSIRAGDLAKRVKEFGLDRRKRPIEGFPLEFSTMLQELNRRVQSANKWEDSGVSVKVNRILDPLSTDLQERIRLLTWGKSSWLSHNGVAIPDKWSLAFPRRITTIRTNAIDVIQNQGWGVVALADSLRPDASVSRDLVRQISWRIQSAAILALCRAVQEVSNDLPTLAKPFGLRWSGHLLLEGHPPAQAFLEHILDDELLTCDAAWQQMPILEARSDGHNCLLSLEKIRALLEDGKPVELVANSLSHGRGWVDSNNFIEVCTAALMQIGLNVSARIDGDVVTAYVPSRSKPPPVLEGQRLFPPLLFLPFSGSSRFKTIGHCNQDHPFSKWLIERAPLMAEKYPGILNSMRSALIESFNGNKCRTAVNQALERLRQLDPDLAPQRLFLKPQDFLF
jgi:hypothetical protein